MFKYVEQSDKAPVLMEFYVTNNEAITEGEALVLSSGRLTKAAANGAVGFIAMHSVVAGIDKKCKVIAVMPGQVWEVGYTGTPDGGFIVGLLSADIDDTGLLLNAADVTSGPCGILSLDAAAHTARVVFTNRSLG